MQKEPLKAALLLWWEVPKAPNCGVNHHWPGVLKERTERRCISSPRCRSTRPELRIRRTERWTKKRTRVEEPPALCESTRKEKSSLLSETRARTILRFKEKSDETRPRGSGAPEMMERAVPFCEREYLGDRDLFEELEELLGETSER